MQTITLRAKRKKIPPRVRKAVELCLQHNGFTSDDAHFQAEWLEATGELRVTDAPDHLKRDLKTCGLFHFVQF